MYVPEHFSEKRTEVIRDIIERYSLGTLVTMGSNGLDANPIPFELVELDGDRGLLRAHVARANPVHQEVADLSDVLVVFRATDAYISPNWYPSKHETHKLVPTWNYQVVNLYGTIKFLDDEKFLRAVVGRLTKAHETKAEGERAWRMSDAPPDYMDAMLKSIVGLEIEVTRVVAKFKLSQNREERDRINAADELGRRGEPELSDAMRYSS